MSDAGVKLDTEMTAVRSPISSNTVHEGGGLASEMQLSLVSSIQRTTYGNVLLTVTGCIHVPLAEAPLWMKAWKCTPLFCTFIGVILAGTFGTFEIGSVAS